MSARPSIAGETSMASTTAPIAAASQASTPLPQPLDAMVAATAQLDHRKLALDRTAGKRHVDHAVDRDHAVELVLDLLDHHRRARGDDGDTREMFLALGLRHRETVDVVAASR